MAKGICSVEDCDSPVLARGWCGKHYQRWRNHGDPLTVNVQELELYPLLLALPTDPGACITLGHTVYFRVFTPTGARPYAHVFVCGHFHGPRPTPRHIDVAHSCGNKGCVRPAHVRWATRVENMNDNIEQGTTNRGVKHGHAKLTEAQVREVRSRVAGGELMRVVARDLGISVSNVSLIVLRQSWSWLE